MKCFNLTNLLLASLLVCSVIASSGESETRKQSIEISKQGNLSEKEFPFTITVNGKSGGEMFADPPGCDFPWKQYFYNSESISLENKGDAAIGNPWITMDGEPDFFSIQTILQSVLPKNATEKEKALSLYEFDRRFTFHEYLGTCDNIDPVKWYNVYGYGICGDDATMLTSLYNAAGLKTRRGRPFGHSTFEVMFDGKFRYLDGDMKTIALDNNNSEIISEEDIARDPYLMKRTHTYGLKNWGWSDARNEIISALYWYRGERSINHQIETGHTMAYSLRPGEKITWLWKERLKPLGLYQDPKREGYAADGKSFHGQLEYFPSKENIQPFLKESSYVIPFRLPYPFAGISVFLPDASVKNTELSLSKDGKTFKIVDTQAIKNGLVNDDFLSALDLPRQAKPAYEIWLKITSKQANASSLFPMQIKLDFQFAPKSMPQLSPGKNSFKYRDGSAKRNVVLNFTWKENSNNPPESPSKPVFPAENSSVKGVKPFVFEWAPSKDSDGSISDYQFQLADHPEFKWPLSSNFDAMLSITSFKGTNKFGMTYPGLLTPGMKYFWRVRARDDKGCWSKWGNAWSFTVDGPGTPFVKTPEVNQAGRSLKLSWEAKGGNSPAVKYRVYGSKYRGFNPSMEGTNMIMESAVSVDKPAPLPPSFLFETDKPEVSISFDDSAKVFPFYRIQALDGNSVEGCFSAQIEVPSPVLLTQLPLVLASKQTNVPLSFISSSGRLVNFEGGGYVYGIGMKDDWNIEVISCEGVSDIKASGQKSYLILTRALNKGEKISCKIRVFGSSYIDFTNENTFDLVLEGGDKTAENPVLPAVPVITADAGNIILKDDFDQKSFDKGGNWNVDDVNLKLEMKNLYGKWFACGSRIPDNASKTYARISRPISSAGQNNGPITISFSLIFSVSEVNYRTEIQFMKKNGDWAYLQIQQFAPPRLTIKNGSAVKNTPSPKSFNFEYNVPVNFKWVIDENGKQALYQDGKLLHEWEAIPGDSYSLENISAFRTAFNMSSESDKGFIGFGDLKISVGNE